MASKRDELLDDFSAWIERVPAPLPTEQNSREGTVMKKGKAAKK
jgi:hypothetical protein